MFRPAFHIAALLVAAAVMTAAAAPLALRKSAERGVTVAVAPLNVAARETVWQFEVTFDTHSQELNDDLVKSALLVDEKGNEARPVAWEGAGPGGHHRKGMLKFKAITPMPGAIELRIVRPGEPAARVFRWELK